MKNKILSWFGLTTLARLNAVETRNNEYLKLMSDLTKALAAYEKYENKPEPEVEFINYRNPEKQTKTSGFDNELFAEWYDIYCRNQYQAYKIRKLTRHPHLLVAFLNEFSSFDWESVRKYMEEVNWGYGELQVVPTVERLKDCVITLLPDDESHYLYSGEIASGGFYVDVYYEEDTCKAVCTIKFKKEDGNYLNFK